jgi:hypothetical protein
MESELTFSNLIIFPPENAEHANGRNLGVHTYAVWADNNNDNNKIIYWNTR